MNKNSVERAFPAYSKWGGFAAVIGSLPDAAEARASDARLDYLLTCLDCIEAASRTYDSIVNTVSECKFTIEDLNRLNSPLLDGLYSVVCLAQDQEPLLPLVTLPDMDTSHASVLTVSRERQYQSLLRNALRIGASVDTLDFLLAGSRSLARDPDILQIASMLGRLDVLELCFSTDVQDNQVSSVDPGTIVRCVRHAASYGRLDVLRLLLRETNLPCAPSEALTAAARRNQTEIVVYLLNRCRESIDIPHADALHESLRHGHVGIAKLLLERGGSPGTILRLFLLQEACSSGSVEAVELMLQAGADIDGFNSSPLLSAVRHGHPHVVQFLVDRGADVSLFRGVSLSLAASCPNFAMLKFILDHGNLYDPDGLDEALCTAVCECLPEHVKSLLEHGALPFVRDMLPRIAAFTNAAILRLFLESGADVHSNDDDALINACRHNPSVVPLLLEFGANILAQNGRPLMHVVQTGIVDRIRPFLESGANLTPYHAQMLLQSVILEDPSMFSYLLAHGVSPEGCWDELVAVAQQNARVDHLELLRESAAKFGMHR